MRGVVAAEMPSEWPAAALQAQAVASRTYALTAHAGGSRFDVYSDTRSQVYGGVAAETLPTNAAVAATAGQIVALRRPPRDDVLLRELRRHDREHPELVPRLRARAVAAGRARPLRQGTGLELDAVDELQLRSAARLQGLVKGAFRGIEVLRRGVSPRIVSALVLGSRGDDARRAAPNSRRASA